MSPIAPVGSARSSGSLALIQARIDMLEQRLGVRRPTAIGSDSSTSTRATPTSAATSAAQASGSVVVDGLLGNGSTGPSGTSGLSGTTDVASLVDELLGASGAGLSSAGATTQGTFDQVFDAAVAELRASWGGTAVTATPATSGTTAVATTGAANATGSGVLAPTTPYASLFEAAGARHGIPPKVLAAIGWVESRFRLDAVSSAGAVGMMQFLPSTAAGMGVDPSDPASAIDGAARYLRTALDRFGSIEQAIAAYNVGPGAIARAGGVLPGSQAERYLQKVLDATGRV